VSHDLAAAASKGTAADDIPAVEEEFMSKQIACDDVVEGCAFTADAPTEKELVDKVVTHAAEKHGVTQVTPELAAKVKAAIKDR
jgi:predicted small metal-binding protein